MCMNLLSLLISLVCLYDYAVLDWRVSRNNRIIFSIAIMIVLFVQYYVFLDNLDYVRFVRPTGWHDSEAQWERWILAN